MMMRRKSVEVPCTIDIEHSFDSLHACVDLDGVEVGPGDEVIVHGAPRDIAPGEKRTIRARATVVRATWLDRLIAKAEGYLELTELYEVGFSEGRTS